MTDQTRPTLLASCASASTAAEARFRVNYPNSGRRRSRIFALDGPAAEAMFAITEAPWQGAHFLAVGSGGDVDPEATGADDLPLSHPDGTGAKLSEEIEGADVVVLISSTGENAGAAEVIAREAYHRHIMCGGLALAGTALANGRGSGAPASSPDSDPTSHVVNTLRPFASILVVARDADFIPAMLNALRA
ncbi:hypothetical protein BV394_06885 [Brevirhabdus pacifica]|uniref:Uncharacterized protein n=1 Tax=Brevirhabdus pacifica TaxID=1267768 RepID=A0A1U7DHV2_9RHOB|nr:hypothetical protein [Brevirhabdus pacifica]APX89473.1 hypothetical protein BV394_06885 [Brevirhabdus pacifica]OWU76519.1 hypothetical protein ATO5_09415 [Loktanella sp. 22II-4b]PJJ85877.1 hypothetical protein CLV77_0409 [Brevirhabdus pacifica]